MSLVLLMCDSTPELHQFTENALASIVGQDETIIVDNASLLGGGFARSKADIYIRNRDNRGYPASVNQAVALSHGEYIAIANNDIRVSFNWREVAEDIFQNPKVGSVHFRMINYEDEMKLGDTTWITGKERWCTASFFVVRREAFVGYDESYKEGGYDDWNYFHRMRHLKGWQTAYTTKACYQHAHSMTYKTLDDGKSRSERDTRNREKFKQTFGAYAEDIWMKMYPDQMGQDYYSFFQTL